VTNPLSALELRARGDRELYDKLIAEREIQKAIEHADKESTEMNARRQLLGTAMRLSPEMAPDVHAIMESCRKSLAIDTPVETYVYPAPMFNAAAVRPERGLMFVLLSSSLLEAFEPAELKFVVGHELGHHLFEHHKIPTGALLSGKEPVSAELALQLFAWQRYAEISCDRAGLACAGSFEPAAHSLFKLASGLKGGRIKIRVDQFVAQVSDLQAEAMREAKADGPMRADWFSTHPFSPLRLRAAELFAESSLMKAGGMSIDALEAQVHELMNVMDPSYLQERSEPAEAMRRLLFAGAVSVATARGEPNKAALEALEKLLGTGSLPRPLNAKAITDEIPKRVTSVNASVPAVRRAQIIRDLCVIARADGHADEAETKAIDAIAKAIGVDSSIVNCGFGSHTDLD
jgi:Zn-dependent protease with chaperone function